MLAPGTVLGERYEIVEKIGAGGMSIVYKAKCNKLQRFVAIKVLREEFAKDEEFVTKFRKEALSAASLSHPNIVGIYDVGSDHDLHYIVMELVEGKTLKEVIAEEGPFSSKEVLDYGMQIVSALRHAHRKKIIHRDIKPQNILITHDHVLKVTDFGIAKAVDSSTIVATGNAIGSVHYFSPEQARGKYVNETSDLYSCGIVLFELATKRLPFEADSHISIALKHINEEMPHPSVYNPNILPNLEALILKATRKLQSERYQNADEMLKDMKGILINPNYVVEEEEVSDHTILMSEADTDLIRNNGYQGAENTSSKTDVPHFDVPPTKPKVAEEEIEEEPEEVSTMYKVLVSIGGVLATLVLIVIISAAAMFWLPNIGSSKQVTVPNLIGKTLDAANKLASSYKLKVEVVGEEATSEVPVGTIYKQTPSESQLVARKTKIQVILAKGGESAETSDKEVTVPDVTGLDSVRAEKLIEDAGLVPMLEPTYDDEVEKGEVISHSPSANERVKEGSRVKILISKGPQVVVTNVPNLLNMTVDNAKVSLRNANLKLGNQKEEFSETVAAGLIINQGVAPNTKIEEDTSIDIVVSKGKEEKEEVSPTPTETPGPEEGGGSQTPGETTKNFILRAPDGDAAESFHVTMRLVLEDGTSRNVYDAVIAKDQFPLSVPIKGRGKGTLYTSFDGKPLYQDDINFNEV